MHEVVQPVVPVPYFMEDNVRFSHVAVDVVQGKDMLFHIIYLATGGLVCDSKLPSCTCWVVLLASPASRAAPGAMFVLAEPDKVIVPLEGG